MKKKYRTQKFEKMLRNLHSPRHVESVRKLYRKEGTGYVLRQDLNKEEKKLLKEVRGILKKNRGTIRLARVVLLGIILGGLIVFFTVFLNPLVSRGIQSGMQAVFSARTEISGLHVRPFQPSISIDYLAQGDSSRPFRNLFEVRDVEIALNGRALLSRSLVIENIQFRDLRWGGERTRSAALEPAGDDGSETGSARQNTRGGGSGSPEESAPAGQIGDDVLQALSLNPEQAFQEFQAGFAAPRAIEEFSRDMQNRVEAWGGRANDIETEVRSFTGQYSDLLDTRPEDFREPERLRSLAVRVQDAVQDASELESSLESRVTQLQEEYADTRARADALREQINADIESVRTEIADVRDTGTAGLVRGFLQSGLEALFGDKSAIVYRGLDIYRNFNAHQDAAPAPGLPDGRRRPPFREGGVDIQFARSSYPAFWLKRAEGGASPENGTPQRLELRNVSSQPEIGGGSQDGGFLLIYEGSIGVPMNLEVTRGANEMEEFQIRLNASELNSRVEQLPDFFRISHIRTSGTFQGNMVLASEGRLNLDTEFRFSQVDVTPAQQMENENTESPGSELLNSLPIRIAQSLETADELNIAFTGSRIEDAWESTSLESNIPGILSGTVDDIISQQLEMLREELNTRIESYRQELATRLDNIYAPAGEIIRGAELDLENLEDTRAELQNLREQALNRAENMIAEQAAAVEEAAREAAREAEEAARRQAEEAEEAARDAARDAAERAAEEAESRLPSLPGF